MQHNIVRRVFKNDNHYDWAIKTTLFHKNVSLMRAVYITGKFYIISKCELFITTRPSNLQPKIRKSYELNQPRLYVFILIYVIWML